MASRKAHYATGVAAGVMAAALVIDAGAGGPFFVSAILTFLAGISGGTAPDWLEVAWWSRRRRLWITHRTLTHWGIAWIALLVYSYLSITEAIWAPVAFGFAAGGLMHLVCDWPNPRGLVWLFRRHSLNLWNSGKCDLILIVGAWASAFFVLDHLFWQNIHGSWVLSHIARLSITS